MLDKKVPFRNIPFFWTRHYNRSIQYVGYAPQYDETFIQGDIKKGESFLVYYIKGNQIHAVSGLMQSGAISTYLEALQQNIMPSADDIKSGKETVETVREKLKQITGPRCKREQCCNMKPQTTA